MRKYIVLLLSLLLVGCAVEEENTQEVANDFEEVVDTETMISSFKLSAVQGYVAQDNYEIPHTYIIDADRNEVYVNSYIEGMSDEEREAFVNMSEKEKEEYFSNQPITEEPLYDITLLEVTSEVILLEYEEERVVFTALSNSTYETEGGTRYTIEKDVSINEYLESLK